MHLAQVDGFKAAPFTQAAGQRLCHWHSRVCTHVRCAYCVADLAVALQVQVTTNPLTSPSMWTRHRTPDFVIQMYHEKQLRKHVACSSAATDMKFMIYTQNHCTVYRQARRYILVVCMDSWYHTPWIQNQLQCCFMLDLSISSPPQIKLPFAETTDI